MCFITLRFNCVETARNRNNAASLPIVPDISSQLGASLMRLLARRQKAMHSQNGCTAQCVDLNIRKLYSKDVNEPSRHTLTTSSRLNDCKIQFWLFEHPDQLLDRGAVAGQLRMSCGYHRIKRRFAEQYS